ncbi:MAG: carbohydrate ABC transporter substrate-binding protein [Oscillospiraceae bacterium]|nr:carbohydrate ABC transporter substrate-binding protein [Oscillospiraceae bacterium]
MKKIIALLLAVVMVLGLAACGEKTPETTAPQGNSGENTPATTPATTPVVNDVTIKVAAIETAYGSEVWVKVAEAFTAETGIKVELTTDKNLEDILTGPMQNGEFPDVVHLATGRPAGLTEQLVKANALLDLTNMLSLTIPGEDIKVADKIAGGFTDNNIVAPYGDGKTYMAPMFYSPCGLFYNAKLFEEKGWTVPTTWDEMWALGDLAAAEGISLFTYPTAGYYDAFMFALMNAIGGPEFFNAVTTYQEGAWDSAEGQALLEILAKLATYTHPSTPAQANNQDFTKNQLMVMTNDALFMPNGTWITGEMAGALETLENEFAWGMTAVPAAGTAPYSFCWFEQAWIPAAAEHIAEAEQFVAFLYSDAAAEIFATAGAMQPILGIADMLEGENVMFYSIYDNGAKAAMGGFAAFGEIPGVDVSGTFFAPIDSLVAGTITIEEYAELVKTNSALMRENLLG